MAEGEAGLGASSKREQSSYHRTGGGRCGWAPERAEGQAAHVLLGPIRLPPLLCWQTAKTSKGLRLDAAADRGRGCALRPPAEGRGCALSPIPKVKSPLPVSVQGRVNTRMGHQSQTSPSTGQSLWWSPHPPS